MVKQFLFRFERLILDRQSRMPRPVVDRKKMQKKPASRVAAKRSAVDRKKMQKKPSMGKRNTTVASAVDGGSADVQQTFNLKLRNEIAQAFVYVQDNRWQIALGIAVPQRNEQTATLPDGLLISGTLAQLDLSSPVFSVLADLCKDKVMYVQIVDDYAEHPTIEKLQILGRMPTMLNILALMMPYAAQPLRSTYAICDISQSINYIPSTADGRVQLLPAQMLSAADSAAIWSFWDVFVGFPYELALTGPQLACVLRGMRYSMWNRTWDAGLRVFSARPWLELHGDVLEVSEDSGDDAKKGSVMDGFEKTRCDDAKRRKLGSDPTQSGAKRRKLGSDPSC